MLLRNSRSFRYSKKGCASALLLLSLFHSSSHGYDPDEFPLIRTRPMLRFPAEVRSRSANDKDVATSYRTWDFGFAFRVESLLCRRFSAIDCYGFTGQQVCKIDFKLQDGSKISDVKITNNSNNTGFDSLAKKLILDLSGSPELQFPKSLMGKSITVSSTFHKEGTSRWVDVRLDDGSELEYLYKLRKEKRDASSPRVDSPNKPLIDLRKPPLEEQVPQKPSVPDRQMIEYENENGEKRIKLIPVDNGVR